MNKGHDSPDREPPASASEHPRSGPRPVYFRPNPYAYQHTLREGYASAWAMGPANLDEVHEAAVARGQLEQVGRILERLELQRTEISELRAETRDILARLAA
jgi:hypothetical protein